MRQEKIMLKDIAGYATERMVWQMMLNLSEFCTTQLAAGVSPQDITIKGDSFLLSTDKVPSANDNKAFAAPEIFNPTMGFNTGKSGIWTLGALAFYVITGTDVFEAKGGETQTETTEVPRISSTYANMELSNLIRRSLNYLPQNRPTIEEIQTQAREALAKPAQPRKRLTSSKGKSYPNSLVKFWPEEMVTILLAYILFALPQKTLAQSTPGFDKSAIPNEMATLVLRCVDLRSSQNIGKVSKAMDRDMNWTIMDELPLDKNGECTTKDVVDMFGLNDLGFRILKRYGGVTNAGGRFRDGRDPRYKYSFIEITVKKGSTVNYNITGREGEQVFAIVPFEKDAKFKASIPQCRSFKDDGVCYIRMRNGLKKTDSFMLTIENASGKNMAFAIINYNSRNNE